MNNELTTESEEPPSKEWTLLPQNEYRFELDPGNVLAVQVQGVVRGPKRGG